MQPRTCHKVALAAILATSTIASAQPGTIQSYDGYKSWFVVCDNTLTCVARGFTDTDQGAQIEIERQAGPKGALTISIGTNRPFTIADVKIDGKAAGLSPSAWDLAVSEDETSLTTDDIGAAQALVRRLRDASKVTLGGTVEVPLDGFAAAMLRIDQRQGRLGGVTALLERGPLPAVRVPVAPSVPRIPAHPIGETLTSGEAARLVDAVRADQKPLLVKEECEAAPAGAEPEAYALDAKRALVFLPCLTGAYQSAALAFIAPRAGGRAERLIAPTPYLGNDGDPPGADFFTESSFDAATGTLAMAARGRGLADCGMSAGWTWNGERFVLSEMTLQQACGGLEPGDWPTLFRSVR